MSNKYTINAMLPVAIADRLHPNTKLPHERVPAIIDAKLKPLVNKQLTGKNNVMKDNAEWVLPYVNVPAKALLGLFARKTQVPVKLLSWKHTWTKNGCYLTLNWEAVTTKDTIIDVKSVKEVIAGGITDGWGDGVEQSSRFGEVCIFDEEKDRYRSATTLEKRTLSMGEDGRYALLPTLKSSKISITKKSLN